MTDPNPDTPLGHFEDFIPRGGTSDIFQKVHDLDAFLKQNQPG